MIGFFVKTALHVDLSNLNRVRRTHFRQHARLREGTAVWKKKILLPGATWDLHGGTPKLMPNLRVSSESNLLSDNGRVERLSSQASSSRGRFELYGSTAEPAPNIVRSIEQTAIAAGCDSESSPLKSTSAIHKCASPLFSPETKKKWMRSGKNSARPIN